MKSSNQASQLFNIPLELRLMIINLVLPDRIRLVPRGSKESAEFIKTHGLFFSNHELRRNALDELKRQMPKTTFITAMESARRYQIPSECPPWLSQVQNLVIEVGEDSLFNPNEPGYVTAQIVVQRAKYIIMMTPGLKSMELNLKCATRKSVRMMADPLLRRYLQIFIRKDGILEGWEYKTQRLGRLTLLKPTTGGETT